MSKSLHIIVGVTGSIAAYRSADIVRRLIEEGFRVSVVMTQSAEQFITPLTLSSLSGNRVYQNMFSEAGHPWEMPHIALAKSADAVLIAPATANIIGKLACGIADELLACVVLATKAPVILAPAMNDEMYLNKIVQDNCSKLQKHGMIVVEPVTGQLACGTFGVGHIAETDAIVQSVKKLLSKSSKVKS